MTAKKTDGSLIALIAVGTYTIAMRRTNHNKLVKLVSRILYLQLMILSEKMPEAETPTLYP